MLFLWIFWSVGYLRQNSWGWRGGKNIQFQFTIFRKSLPLYFSFWRSRVLIHFLTELIHPPEITILWLPWKLVEQNYFCAKCDVLRCDYMVLLGVSVHFAARYWGSRTGCQNAGKNKYNKAFSVKPYVIIKTKTIYCVKTLKIQVILFLQSIMWCHPLRGTLWSKLSADPMPTLPQTTL